MRKVYSKVFKKEDDDEEENDEQNEKRNWLWAIGLKKREEGVNYKIKVGKNGLRREKRSGVEEE